MFGFWELPYAVTTAVPKGTNLRRTALACSKRPINIDRKACNPISEVVVGRDNSELTSYKKQPPALQNCH